MKHSCSLKGVCSRKVQFELEEGIVTHIEFEGGCSGNAQGISSLAEGMSALEIIKRLSGIKCGYKDTSCPEQLAKVLETLTKK